MVEVRNPRWAEPIYMIGVPNLHKVSTFLYRSAQPTGDGMSNLLDFGVTRVINLRALHPDPQMPPGVVNLRREMNAWHIEDEDVVWFLRQLCQHWVGATLFHCQHGADRTGTMAAMVRIVFEGWSREDAIDELVNGGYGFHRLWSNIPNYLMAVDIEKIKKQVWG